MARGRRGSVQHNPQPKHKSSTTENGFDPNLLAADISINQDGTQTNNEGDENSPNDFDASTPSSPRSTRFQAGGGGGGFLSGSSPLNRVLSSRSATERRNQQRQNNNQSQSSPLTPTGTGLRALDRWTAPFARKQQQQQRSNPQNQDPDGLFGSVLTKSITDSSPFRNRHQQQQQQQQQQVLRDGLVGNIYSNGDIAGSSRRDLSRYPTSTGTTGEMEFSPRSTNLRRVDTSNTTTGMARLEPLYTVDGSYSGSLYDNNNTNNNNSNYYPHQQQHKRPNSGYYNSANSLMMMPPLTRAQSGSSIPPNRLTRMRSATNTGTNVDEQSNNFSPQDTLIYNALFGTKLPEGSSNGFYSKPESDDGGGSRDASFSIPESSSNSIIGQTTSNGSRPMAMPKCDRHDVLWAEVDVMEEIESISGRIDKDDSFFGRRHAEALDELRNAQLGLAAALDDIDNGQLETSHHAGAETKKKFTSSEREPQQQQQQQQLPKAFDHHYHLRDLDAIRENTFGQEQFDDIQKAVDRVIGKLAKVGNAMRDVEDTSGENVWNDTNINNDHHQRRSSKNTNQVGVGSLTANSAPSIAEQQQQQQ